eukprot:5563869-Amphidinium_carterae.1
MEAVACIQAEGKSFALLERSATEMVFEGRVVANGALGIPCKRGTVRIHDCMYLKELVVAVSTTGSGDEEERC